MLWISVLVGTLLILAGRQLFWAFIGVVGFLFGFRFVELLMANYPAWVQLTAGLVCGGVCIILALVFYRFALILAGILTGGLIAVHVTMAYSQVVTSGMPEIAFITGGLIGGLLAAFLLDWAIITLSSLMGASLIAEAFFTGPITDSVIIIGLCLIGIAVQGEQLKARVESNAKAEQAPPEQ